MYRNTNCTVICMNIIADTSIFMAVALDEPEKERIIEVAAGVFQVSIPSLRAGRRRVEPGPDVGGSRDAFQTSEPHFDS